MLGRRADQLYWMARYIERAENAARLLDVSYRMSLIPQSGDARRSAWETLLVVVGSAKDFSQTHGDPTRQNVIGYVALDPDLSNSIFSSIRAARENARALRATIPTEMWECLNGAWLDLQEMTPDSLAARGYRNFFDWVKERMILFRGTAEGTMMRDEGYAFAQLGWDIERADNTARLLDSKYHVLLPESEDVGGAVDYYQWGALLRSLGAFRAYHRVYRDIVKPHRVAELLVLRHDMPRSLRACFDRIVDTLDGVSGRTDNQECQRLAGQLHARLRYGRMDEIFSAGLHEFLIEFMKSTHALGQQIQRDFMMIQ